MVSMVTYVIQIQYKDRNAPSIFDYVLLKIVEHLPEFNKNKPLENILEDLGFSKEVHQFFSSSLDNLLDSNYLTLYSSEGVRRGWLSNNLMNICRDDLVLTDKGRDFMNGNTDGSELKTIHAKVDLSDGVVSSICLLNDSDVDCVKLSSSVDSVLIKDYVCLNKDYVCLSPNVSIVGVDIIGSIGGVAKW